MNKLMNMIQAENERKHYYQMKAQERSKSTVNKMQTLDCENMKRNAWLQGLFSCFCH